MGTLYAGFDLRGNHNYLGIIDGDEKRTRFPFKYLEEFGKYEREARENGKGLWK